MMKRGRLTFQQHLFGRLYIGGRVGARGAETFFKVFPHDFLKKFLTNWRAQRGNFLNTSLIFHDFPKKFLTN